MSRPRYIASPLLIRARRGKILIQQVRSHTCGLMPTAGKRFGAVFRQFFAPLMDRAVANTQFTGDLSNGLAARLNEPHRLALELLRNTSFALLL